MLNIKFGMNCLILSVNGTEFIAHNAPYPFVTAVRQEKSYAANRGTVKVKTAESRRIGLNKVTKEGNVYTFTGGGHSLEMTLDEIPDGAFLSFHGEEGWAYEFRLPAVRDEAVFGGGEQFKSICLNGTKLYNFSTAHIKAFTLVKNAIIPRIKEPHKVGSYSPMPVFVTDKGRVIVFDAASDGYYFFDENEYVFSFDRCPSSLIVHKADSFNETAAFINTLIPNRQYLPSWCHDGMILGLYGGTENMILKVSEMLEAGAKVCGVWCQDWTGVNSTVLGREVYWNWETDEKLYPNLKNTIKKLNERGVKFLSYINPFLVKGGKQYEYCKKMGYLITKSDGSVYHVNPTVFDAGMLDLTNPDAVDYIKEVIIKQNMLDIGITGWMADCGEYLPLDCELYNGDPAVLHNFWPVMWAKINREAVDEYGDEDTVFFSRAGYLGIQQYAPIMYNGDQYTDFSESYGMPSVIPATFSLGMCGVSLVHNDIGGYFSLGNLYRDEETYVRWMEMDCFSLMMRSHPSISPKSNAQHDSEGVKKYTVRLSSLHSKLGPYLEKCVDEAQMGIPAVRPDFWESMDYTDSRDPYAYYLGDDLFVCPVTSKKAVDRRVHLPQGEWINLWTGREYRGGKAYTFMAPLGRLPVFYRKGSEFKELFESITSEYHGG